MFPIRRELVGKRFAFIHGDGRTGTRKRGSQTGLIQNWTDLNWVTGTILAANVDGLDAQEDSIFSKKVKVFVQYDTHYQLQKEWIKLYSGSHRIFFIEENLVLCQRKGEIGYSSRSYGWPALRLVPIVDRNFMDENPHLIPVEYMGGKKQLSFIAFEDIIKLFPDEDQSLLLQSLQQDPYLKSDYQSWERTQKTQMILLYGPYSLTGCRVEVNNPSLGRCYRAVIISHDYMKRVLDVMDDQLLKSQKVNPKLIQVNFLASDEDIDKLMYGEAPKAIPTRYSRYGHQVHPSRCQPDELGPTSHQSTHFTLPQWMMSLNFMDQDQSNKIAHSEYQAENAMPPNRLSTVVKHCDNGKLDASPIGPINVSDEARPAVDIQIGMQNPGSLSNQFNDAQRILNSEGQLKEHPCTFSPDSIDSSLHCAPKYRAAFESHLKPSPVLTLPIKSTHNFGSPMSSSRSRASCIDQPKKDQSIKAQISDATMCYPLSSSLTSQQGQVNDIYANLPTQSHIPETKLSKCDEFMKLGCYQPPQHPSDSMSEKRYSVGQQNSKLPSGNDRLFPGVEVMSSIPKNFEIKNGEDLKLQQHSSLSASDQRVVPPEVRYHQNEHQSLQLSESTGGPLTNPELTRPILKVKQGCFDGIVQNQSVHQSIKSQPTTINQADVVNFLKNLDACFNAPTRTSQHMQGSQNLQNFSSSSSSAPFQPIKFPFDPQRSCPNVQEGIQLELIQERFRKLYPQSPCHDVRTLQELYEQYIKSHVSAKHGTIASNQLHSCASGLSSFMTRSLSSDNFPIGSGQLNMSPPNAAPKKLKGKGRRKARSKDDTSKPSPEASIKVSSLLLSSKNGKDRDKDKKVKGIVHLDKESSGVNGKTTEVISNVLEESVVGNKAKGKSKCLEDPEGKVPSVIEHEGTINQDMTARVALAFAGFSHGLGHDKIAQCTAPYTAVQKMPSGATWIKDIQSELSNGEASKAEIGAIEGKTGFRSTSDVLIDTPPSPEFLPMKDKEIESAENLIPVPHQSSGESGKELKMFLGNIREFQKDIPTVLANSSLTEFVAAPVLHNRDLSVVSAKSKVTFLDEKDVNGIEYNAARKSRNSPLVVGTNFEHPETSVKHVGFSKVPISSVSVASLGLRLEKSADVSDKNIGNATDVVRNIYGRTLYKKAQRGPSFAQQLRTDKIIGCTSPTELKNGFEPLPETCPLKSPPMNNNSEGNDHAAASSDLKEVLRTKMPLIETPSGSHVATPALLSSKLEMTTSLLKKDHMAKARSEKLMKPVEKIAKKTTCKHKRKPCKCDLEQTFANLFSNAPLSHRTNTYFQSLQRLINEKGYKLTTNIPGILASQGSHQSSQTNLQLPPLNYGAQLTPDSNSNKTQYDIQMNTGTSPWIEKPVSLMTSKELPEKLRSQHMESPETSMHGESVVQPLAVNLINSLSDNLDPNTLEPSRSFNYLKSFEQRSSEKCKHKRRPCRCDFKAAVELNGYIQSLSIDEASKLSCFNDELVKSSLIPSSNPHVSSQEEQSAEYVTGFQISEPDGNGVESRSFGIKNHIENESVADSSHSQLMSADSPNVVKKFECNKEKDMSENAHQTLITENATSEKDFRQNAASSSCSNIVAYKLVTKSDDNFATSKQSLQLDSTVDKKCLVARKCKHKRKPCKCDSIEEFNIDSMRNAVRMPSSDHNVRGFTSLDSKVIELARMPKKHRPDFINDDYQEESKKFDFSCNDSDDLGLHRDLRSEIQESSKSVKQDNVSKRLPDRNEKHDPINTHHGFTPIGSKELLGEIGNQKVLDNEFCNSVEKYGFPHQIQGVDVNQVNVDKIRRGNLEKRSKLNDRDNVPKSAIHKVEVGNKNVEIPQIEKLCIGNNIVKPKSHLEEVTPVVKLKEYLNVDIPNENREKAVKPSCCIETDIPKADGRGAAVECRIINLAEDRQVDKDKRIVLLNGTSNLQDVDYQQGYGGEVNVNQELLVECEVGKQNESKALERSVKTVNKSASNRNCLDSLPYTPSSPVQIHNTNAEKPKLLIPNSSLKISVPANLPITSSILCTPGNRFTARAKIVCPEKNLEPLKGAPVNVSFDGGKTFALASIVEIKNRSDHSHINETQEMVATKEQSTEVHELKSQGVAKKPTTIDAVLLGYSTSESTRKDLTEKEINSLERIPSTTKNNKKVAESPCNAYDSSDGDGDDINCAQIKKEAIERLRVGEQSNETRKELRRSSRFAMKCDDDKDIWPEKGVEEEVGNTIRQSICSESAQNFVLSRVDVEEKLSSEALDLTGENRKAELEELSIATKSIAAGTTNKKKAENGDDFKKTTQTIKDEMFDCCAIHQDLFCQKCLPFKKKEGHWPVSSRSKEINAAWRCFVRRCPKHDCSKCVDCYNIEREVLIGESDDFNYRTQQGSPLKQAKNESHILHKEVNQTSARLKETEKFDNGMNDLVPHGSTVIQLDRNDGSQDKTESVQVASISKYAEEVGKVDAKPKGRTKKSNSIDKEMPLNLMNAELINEKDEDISELEFKSTALANEHNGACKEYGSTTASKKVLGRAETEGENKEKTEDERLIDDTFNLKEISHCMSKRSSRLKLKHSGIKYFTTDESSKWQQQPATKEWKEQQSSEAVTLSVNVNSNHVRNDPDLPTVQREPTDINKSQDCYSGNVPINKNIPFKKYAKRNRKPLELGLTDKTDYKDTVNESQDNDKVIEPSIKEEVNISNNKSCNNRYVKCLIHGRKTCTACRPFFEKDGKWPRWARRGEVRFLWESMNKEKTKIKTVKCRIHLKAKCSRCLPFKSKNGIWPSWLQRDEVEGHHGKTDKAEAECEEENKCMKLRNTPPDKEYICEIHSKAFCMKCCESRLKFGKWPIDVKLVDKAYKERQKRKLNTLSTWNRCEIHEEQICLPCFYFWQIKGKAPYNNDKQVVNQMWEALTVKLSKQRCEIHQKCFCKSCTPILLSEDKFPDFQSHLKSIYSWELFKDLLEQYSPTEITEELTKNVDRGQRYARKSKGYQLLKKIDTIRQNISREFYCTLHEAFPCFVCMPKFVADSSWPNEREYDDVWKGWVAEHPEHSNCAEHGEIFCNQCNEITVLFEKFHKPGVTDVFLNLVRKDLERKNCKPYPELFGNTFEDRNGPGLHKMKRKRKRGCSDRKNVSFDDPRNDNISVSSKGRVRSKVSRPGTVDISELAEDFIDKGCMKKPSTFHINKAQKKKSRTVMNERQQLRKQIKVPRKSEPIKRKRGRPPKKVLEIEEPAPKKQRRRRKNGLVEQVRSGTLKIINVDNLRDQLENEQGRDSSPAHMEYIQLLENAEKMNVKYFAISVDSIHASEQDKLKKEVRISEDKEHASHLDCDKLSNNEAERRNKTDESKDVKHGKEDVVPKKELWSERDIELILQKVQKVAEAAKVQKEEALHRKKQRQGKKPLTVAQVLAIKRKRGGDTGPVMDDNAREDLEKMLKEAERRRVDLDTLLDEAIKTKDNQERRRKVAKQKAKARTETFLQEKPCDQTPKLPKCRDCRIVDKRNADQHAFCRFVMFRRLFKRPKTGKVEGAGFCSPESADQNAFVPWIAEPNDIDMKADICHYIIKNIAGQFCAVIEEECKALMLGTKDGAVAWKRAVSGVREMCDACATTVFNIHWVCEKCGFGVCLDCFKSKISEKEVKDRGHRAFAFNWSSCAPGLSHKPGNLTVTQIIPKDALWELCLKTVDVCEALSIPYKLSENVLKKASTVDDCVDPDKEKEKYDSEEKALECNESDLAHIGGSIFEHSSAQSNVEYCGLYDISEDLKVDYPCTKAYICNSDNVESSVVSSAIVHDNQASTITAKPQLEHSSDGLMKPLTFVSSSDYNDVETPLKPSSTSMQVDSLVCGKAMQMKPFENDVLSSAYATEIESPSLPQSTGQLNEAIPPLGSLHQKLEKVTLYNLRDDNNLYYGNVCRKAFLVLDRIRKWKNTSKFIKEDVEVGSDNAEDIDTGCNQKDANAIDFGNDSLLSDISMASDDAEILGDPSSDEICIHENSSDKQAKAIVSSLGPGTILPDKLRDSCKIESTQPLRKQVSSTFQNNLDILAMVASGFLQSNKEEECNEESISCDIAKSMKQANTSKDYDIRDGVDPASILDEPALVIKEFRLGNEQNIAGYLCDGELLQLNYSRHPKNIELFRSVWTKGFPLLVSGVHDLLDKGLWNPESFADDFGDELADVVNCLTGETLHQFSVGDFWKGFESIKDRPTDHHGSSMLLKLKDWPPGADFCDKMPKRFGDLMDAIPLPEYTRRDGHWNLVSRLPTNHFIKPDLGPKMYNAYGSAAAPSAGTTNLHLDMSDAVNVMVYVGVPCDPLLGEQEVQDALRTVDLACCDKTKYRVRQPNIIPGALWHIYAAEDADKIRRFLRKVAEERKIKYSIHNDPIHDQSFYLDYDMRKRLKDDYNVSGFAICQCLGDAVFIPAGAPHQVLNLHSCVKVAEDFVSPERIGQCFNLTQEFRYLSDRHTNHEDKLQVKNIIYHAVKDSISVLKECQNI